MDLTLESSNSDTCIASSSQALLGQVINQSIKYTQKEFWVLMQNPSL